MGAKLKKSIKGTVLKLDSKGHFKHYSHQSMVPPGSFDFVPGLGTPPKIWRSPPDGRRWIMDYNHTYWEVLENDLNGAIETPDSTH